MARQASTSHSKEKPQSKDTSLGRKRSAGHHRDNSDKSHFLDDRTRRDIAGVIWILVGIILLLIVLLPSQEDSGSIVTSAVSDVLHLIFGVGCYICPIFLIVIGVMYLIRSVTEKMPKRVTIGLAIVFVALLGIIASFTPIFNIGIEDPNLLFVQSSLRSYGGYVGAGIAWVGLTLFGQVITCVILAGVMLIGVIILGFSFSRLFERIRTAAKSRNSGRDSEEGDLISLPNGRTVRRRTADSVSTVQNAQFNTDNDTELLVTPAHALTSNMTTQLNPEDNDRGNRRHRATRDLNEISGSTPTQQFNPQNAAPTQQFNSQDDALTQQFNYPDEFPTYTGFNGDDGMGQTQAMPMTRKLGKKNRNVDKEPVPPDEETPETNDNISDDTLTLFDAMPQPQEGFILPDPSLLKTNEGSALDNSNANELQQTAERLQETLEDFGIMAEVVGWVAGPTVTLFKINLPSGVRVSRVTALNDDIALALAAPGVRIFAPIPGTNYVGIEVPNQTRQIVLLSDVLGDAGTGPLQIAIGKDVEGHSIVLDLAKMPHLLIGGSTGSGKSVCINAIIMSILMRATPSEVRFILIDPKRVEFTPYNGIPHLYVPVVTEAREAASALSWGVAEMERRLKVFSKVGARNISQYNAKVQQAKAEEQKALEAGEEPDVWEYDDELPYIVIIIDELADLMMNEGKEVEFSISRIAQLARAAGIHLIVATQRPSANVVTGLIKANITNRIAFNVASSIDSRVIIDTPGAENLIGNGDMLLSRPEYAKPQRIQGCFVSEDEINDVVSVLKAQGEPDYHSEILSTNIITLGSSSPDGNGGSSSDDPLLWDAADTIVSSGSGSTSFIQRRLKVGYSRAGRIMDQLEEKGIVGPANGSKPREVLVDTIELETLKAFESQDNDETSSFVEE